MLSVQHSIPPKEVQVKEEAEERVGERTKLEAEEGVEGARCLGDLKL